MAGGGGQQQLHVRGPRVGRAGVGGGHPDLGGEALEVSRRRDLEEAARSIYSDDEAVRLPLGRNANPPGPRAHVLSSHVTSIWPSST